MFYICAHRPRDRSHLGQKINSSRSRGSIVPRRRTPSRQTARYFATAVLASKSMSRASPPAPTSLQHGSARDSSTLSLRADTILLYTLRVYTRSGSIGSSSISVFAIARPNSLVNGSANCGFKFHFRVLAAERERSANRTR